MAPVPHEHVNGSSIRNYISRCVVCEAPSIPIAVHNQYPDQNFACPNNWTSLWDGYSFVMVGTAVVLDYCTTVVLLPKVLLSL